MAKRPALGKGMGALLGSAVQSESNKFFLCPVDVLQPLDNQPRKNFDSEKLGELVESIKEKGIIQPLVVRQRGDQYQIIAGERRWRAAREAGLKEVPVVIQDVTEDWAYEIALIENIQREDLNPIEEAVAYRNLIDSFDLSQDEVAKRVGKSRSTIANSLRLLRLPENILHDVVQNTLSMGHARALLSLEQEEDMQEARTEIIARNLSVRDTEELVRKIKQFGAAPPKNKPTAPVEDFSGWEQDLAQRLGTRVKIRSQGQGGRVELNFKSRQQLEALMKLLDLPQGG